MSGLELAQIGSADPLPAERPLGGRLYLRTTPPHPVEDLVNHVDERTPRAGIYEPPRLALITHCRPSNRAAMTGTPALEASAATIRSLPCLRVPADRHHESVRRIRRSSSAVVLSRDCAEEDDPAREPFPLDRLLDGFALRAVDDDVDEVEEALDHIADERSTPSSGRGATGRQTLPPRQVATENGASRSFSRQALGISRIEIVGTNDASASGRRGERMVAIASPQTTLSKRPSAAGRLIERAGRSRMSLFHARGRRAVMLSGATPRGQQGVTEMHVLGPVPARIAIAPTKPRQRSTARTLVRQVKSDVAVATVSAPAAAQGRMRRETRKTRATKSTPRSSACCTR